ncbi:hypothetical protein Ahy_A03g013610 isoform B [Arachis hypogaea]|uniref:Uncharacterized protein n=1 Tax=Arachis hypogaea TaxID=3818 RepID=A0A445DVR6_ARAHY|nr:hypothetical protein Ahy_A03g013610 isoform B [Arachis hypogaea]
MFNFFFKNLKTTSFSSKGKPKAQNPNLLGERLPFLFLSHPRGHHSVSVSSVTQAQAQAQAEPLSSLSLSLSHSSSFISGLSHCLRSRTEARHRSVSSHRLAVSARLPCARRRRRQKQQVLGLVVVVAL